jgi:NADH-quinone oxidoreductase subunit L
LAIVPGDGAVVVGTGREATALRVRVKPGQETVIAPVGPTVTFREIQDQLVLKDDQGKMFLRDSLMDKRVWGIALITLACLCFFLGATGKSAQIPLFTWLPDAMAGPTPVSALIHAATMVTAGVYMVARFNFLFSLSVNASGVVALVGAATAIFAASIGFFQYDIKKVLAYSTVSQLGFMFIGVGVGAYWAGVFHLMTHAFFKACLFLGSGSVIHGMHAVEHDEVGAQDMRNMGGLKRVMPRTAKTYFISCLAITAAPIPFFAGFWSKDEILWKAFNTQGTGFAPGVLIYAIGLVAALGTSFYMWRSYYLTFEGKHANKSIAKKVHESPGAMVNVLIVLAALSVFAGALFGFSMHYLGGHGEPILEKWLHSSLAHSAATFGDAGLGTEYMLMALSVGGAILAWHLARKRYGADRPKDWAEREQALPGFKLLNAKYYVDEIYDASFVRAVLTLRKVFAEMDRWIVDGLVNASAMASRAGSWVVGVHDKYVVDGLVNLVANVTLGAGGRLRRVQTGRIQNYVYGILGGVLFFALLRYFLR